MSARQRYQDFESDDRQEAKPGGGRRSPKGDSRALPAGKYDDILRHVESEIGNQETDEDTLRDVCQKVFGSKFAGVYASDDSGFKVIQDTGKKYAILNASKRSTGGTHWFSVCKVDKDTLLVSDSFGRSIHDYCEDIKNLKQNRYRIVNTDRRPEQMFDQDNCGARSIAWLILCDVYGANVAKLI